MSFQSQTIAEGGVGIQFGAGATGNTVNIGISATKLTLARPQARKATPKTELELLRVDIRATALVGREDDLAALGAWRDSDRPITLRCLVARAGTGKTRLAVELCELSEAAGWTAGFVHLGPFQAFVQAAADWRWDAPTLVVVDYAASATRALRDWLDILAKGANAGRPKLRLLLLERHADAALGWWSDLMRPGSFSAASPDELADPPEPVALQSLGKLEDRRALLAEAMRLAGALAEPPVSVAPPAPGADPAFDQRLADEDIDNEPLFLMMAGVEAVHTAAPTAVRLDRTVLADRAAGREHGRLERLAAGWGWQEGLLPHLALCLTMQGGCAAAAATALLREECAALEFASPGPPHKAIERLADALPAAAMTEIDGLRPDLVGEAFILALMRKLDPSMQTGIVERAWKRASIRVAASLVRTAQDFAHGDVAHASVRWLSHAIDRTQETGELLAVADALPLETVALREVAAATSDRIVGVFRSLSPITANPAPKARGFSSWLRKLARRGTERSPRTEPRDFRPELAFSLNTRALRLAALGQSETALDAAREAADIYRKLSAQRPDAFRASLAMSLNTLAIRFHEAGRRDCALKSAREARDVNRALADWRPDVFRPSLAISLDTLAGMLREAKQPEAALDAVREAVDLRRELAAQRPDEFRFDLARSLNNLAAALSDGGEHETALDAASDAVDLYRTLVSQRPDAFRPYLAGSLANLAARLGEMGQSAAALAAASDAVDIYRELAAQRPDAFRPELGRSLAVLAKIQGKSGAIEEAFASSNEAIEAVADAFHARPMAFAGLMDMIARFHFEHCMAAGRTPNAARWNPIIIELHKLKGEQP